MAIKTSITPWRTVELSTGAMGTINNNTVSEITFTVPRVTEQNVVVATCTNMEAGLVWTAFVSAKDTVKVRVANSSGGNVAAGTKTFKFVIL